MALVTKSFSDIITFTRASGATWFNSAGNLIGVDFSTSSNTIGTGSKTFTLDATAGVNRSWATGDSVLIVDQANSANNMTGAVTSYTASTQTLVVNVTSTAGSGTITSWRIGNLMQRLDYNPATLAARGLLIEEARTNSIRNNTMQGAVAGTPGTLPTNWTSTTISGLTREIVGQGTVNEIAYIDVRYTGTPSTTSAQQIQPESSTGVAALQNQTWTGSAWVALVGGTLTNITSFGIGYSERDSGGSSLASNVGTAFTPTATFTRQTYTRTLTNASTAFYNTNVRFGFVDTVTPIDITIRIGLPQLELGAFATSVIPTTTTALTRSADAASVNTLSPWFNATESTLYLEFTPVGMKSVGGTALVSIDNGATATERIALIAASNNGMQNITTVAGSTSGNSQTPVTIYAANTTYKIAMAVKLNDIQSFANGVAGTVGTTALMPSGLTNLQFNKTYAIATSNNGWIRRFTYYPRKLSAAEGQAITA